MKDITLEIDNSEFLNYCLNPLEMEFLFLIPMAKLLPGILSWKKLQVTL